MHLLRCYRARRARLILSTESKTEFDVKTLEFLCIEGVNRKEFSEHTRTFIPMNSSGLQDWLVTCSGTWVYYKPFERLGMNHLALERLRAFKLRYEGLLIWTSAKYDLVKLNNFISRFTLNKEQFPFRIVSIADNLLHFRIKHNMLVKFELSGICIEILTNLPSCQKIRPVVWGWEVSVAALC